MTSRALEPAPHWWRSRLGLFVLLGFSGLGALLLLALTVGGQMIASIIVDHYGLLGFAREPVDATRLVGVVLLLGGIFLIAR